MCDAEMQPQQQQTTVVTGVSQPYIVSTPQQGPFNHRQALIVGVVLIILGCLGVLFNTVDLAIGTSSGRVTKWDEDKTGRRRAEEIKFNKDNTLSHATLGVVGHGIWCGVFVSKLTNNQSVNDKLLCSM